MSSLATPLGVFGPDTSKLSVLAAGERLDTATAKTTRAANTKKNAIDNQPKTAGVNPGQLLSANHSGIVLSRTNAGQRVASHCGSVQNRKTTSAPTVVATGWRLKKTADILQEATRGREVRQPAESGKVENDAQGRVV